MTHPLIDPSEHESEGQELAARIRAGDVAAFEEMFRAYGGPLKLFAKGVLRSSTDDAADVVQDVFVRLWHGRATWVCRGSLRAYLYTAVRNQALNRLRHLRTRERADEVMEHEAAVVADLVYADAEGRDTLDDHLERCERALGKLSHKHRQVLLLHWQHDLSYAEIAAILEIPLKTVDSRIRHALQLMRRLCHP